MEPTKIDEMKAEMEKLDGELKLGRTNLDKLIEDKAEEKLITAGRTQYDEMNEKWKVMVTSFETAKKDAEELKGRNDILKEFDLLSLPEDKNLVNPKKEYAQARDLQKEEEAHILMFGRHILEGVDLDKFSGRELAVLAPGSESAMKKVKRGIRMPLSIVSSILGLNCARQLFMQPHVMQMAREMISTNAGDANLIDTLGFKSQLLETPMPTGFLVNKATIIPAQNGIATWPKLTQSQGTPGQSAEFGGVIVTRTIEGVAKTETEPTIGSLEINTYELSAYTKVTETMIRRSAIDIASLLTRLFRGAINYYLDYEILQGAGPANQQILGVVNAGIQQVARTTNGTVVENDLDNMISQLPGYHRSGIEWVMGDDVEGALRLLNDGELRRLFSASMANGPFTMLKGYNYFLTGNNSPVIGNASDIVLGLWNAIYLGLEADIIVARGLSGDDFIENKETFKTHMHIGGRPAHPRLFCELDDTVS